MMAVAEQAILTGILASKETAEQDVEALVREHSRLVFKIAYTALRNSHDAEDIVQEVFLRVLRRKDRLGEVEDMRAWLARITWNVVTDRRRGARDTEDLEDVAEPRSPAASPEHEVERQEMAEVVARMIAALPRELRDPLVLSTMQEMAGVEVAAVLGIPEAAVRSRVFRARQILKEKLAAYVGSQHGT
ncbi:MAG: RNA polymerase sigma factor [Acidobacteriia bacterium]|nr:RNA polymerase sigma factor [Terriglobia bacterium]